MINVVDNFIKLFYMPAKKSDYMLEALEVLFNIGSEMIRSLPLPLETPYEHLRRVRSLPYKTYYDSMHQLHKRGVVRISKKDDRYFIELTQKGALEMLMEKAGMDHQGAWDGKWRLIIFDIPEKAHLQRDRLRWLLKKNGFIKLQASVFINPYPFNRQAIAYLEETGLNKYIRILRVDDMGDDKILKKKFNL